MKAWQIRARDTALKSAATFSAALREDGSFGPEHEDIASYYKAPAMFFALGYGREAHLVLDHVIRAFGRPSGRFAPTADPLLSQYPAYPSGWIAISAQRMGRFEISVPTWQHLQRFADAELGGCRLADPDADDNGDLEMLLTAHLGLAALYFGHRQLAERCGACLLSFLERQPAPASRMYLRMNVAGELITQFADTDAFTHLVDGGAAGQGWFFIGYPIAFLALLGQYTGQDAYLAGAGRYFNFATRCKLLADEHFAHKVAWAAAIYAEITGDHSAWELCEAVVANLIDSRAAGGGLWLADASPRVSFDQSAEVTLWLFDIATRGR